MMAGTVECGFILRDECISRIINFDPKQNKNSKASRTKNHFDAAPGEDDDFEPNPVKLLQRDPQRVKDRGRKSISRILTHTRSRSLLSVRPAAVNARSPKRPGHLPDYLPSKPASSVQHPSIQRRLAVTTYAITLEHSFELFSTAQRPKMITDSANKYKRTKRTECSGSPNWFMTTNYSRAFAILECISHRMKSESPVI
jgi:hypothetical protein